MEGLIAGPAAQSAERIPWGCGGAGHKPLLIAHGVNSRRRAWWAAGRGFDGVEVDVAINSHGELVACHVGEEEAAACASGCGRCPRGVRLSWLLDALPRRMLLLLDCKAPGVASRAASLALSMGFNPVYVASRNHAEVSRLAVGAGALASLDSRLVGLADYLDRIGVDGVTIRAIYVDADVVAELHGRGLLVAVWVVDDARVAREAAGMGVDMIITNRPDVLGGAGRKRLRLRFPLLP